MWVPPPVNQTATKKRARLADTVAAVSVIIKAEEELRREAGSSPRTPTGTTRKRARPERFYPDGPDGGHSRSSTEIAGHQHVDLVLRFGVGDGRDRVALSTCLGRVRSLRMGPKLRWQRVTERIFLSAVHGKFIVILPTMVLLRPTPRCSRAVSAMPRR